MWVQIINYIYVKTRNMLIKNIFKVKIHKNLFEYFFWFIENILIPKLKELIF